MMKWAPLLKEEESHLKCLLRSQSKSVMSSSSREALSCLESRCIELILMRVDSTTKTVLLSIYLFI